LPRQFLDSGGRTCPW